MAEDLGAGSAEMVKPARAQKNLVQSAWPEQAESWLSAIVESSNDAIIGKTLDGMIMSWNWGAQKLYGYTPTEAIGRSIQILVPPDHPDEVPSILQRIREGGRVEHLETVRVRKNGERVHVSITVSPIKDSDGRIVGASTVARDITGWKRGEEERARLLAAERQARAQAEEAEQRLAFLAEASKVLSSSLDYEATLASVARLAVPHIGDWCAVHIVGEDGSVQQLEVAHVDPEKVELAHELQRRYPYDPDAAFGVPQVLRTGKPELTPEIPDELLIETAPDAHLLAVLRDLGFHSSMVVPLVARDRVLGAITLVSAESGRRYGETDLTLAEELASRSAMAVDNARLYQLSARTAAEQAAILEQMADGVALANLDGGITYMNRAARRLTGLSGWRASVQELADLLDPRLPTGEPADSSEAPLARAVRGETVVNVERSLRRPDGLEVVTQTSAAPVLAEDGTPLGAVAVFRDVTAERELDRQKDAFLSAAAHDLKTPLTTIKGLAQVLRRRAERANTEDTPRLVDSLERIDAAATRMSRLVNDLLDVSRVEMGRPLDLRPRSTDIVALLRSLVSEHEHGMAPGRIAVEAASPHVVGMWDADRLERVFTNLLSNAVKYSPRAGEITVRVTLEEGPAGPETVVTVRDRGVGIPAADLPHIFERFYRARNVDDRVQGTGLGLASARQIVEQHGGSISIESRENEGTTARVRLPLADRARGKVSIKAAER